MKIAEHECQIRNCISLCDADYKIEQGTRFNVAKLEWGIEVGFISCSKFQQPISQ